MGDSAKKTASSLSKLGKTAGYSKTIANLDPLGREISKLGLPGLLTGAPGTIAQRAEDRANTPAPIIDPGEDLNTDIPAVPRMPVPGPNSLDTIRARRLSIQAQLARRGRLSTILSQPQYEPLGGTA